jgi:alpha-N-arabinofuranosidase
MLPVRWQDGWPVILTDTATVPYSHAVPALPSDTVGSMPMSGNFRNHDDFHSQTLKPEWEMIRTPRERWYDLGSGGLTIHARPIGIGAKGQPSFIGRRQQHATASASTLMHYRPSRTGDAAGLVAFQSDSFYYFLGETLHDGKRVVRLTRRAGAKDAEGVTIAEAALRSDADALYLRIDARAAKYDFSYAESDGAWRPLARDVDGTILSTHVAGGFVGTMLGMYGYSPPQ